MLVLFGQNDADSVSRNSTRKMTEAKEDFRQMVNAKYDEMERDMAPYPQVKIHFAIPFDDPDGDFTDLYKELVANLTEIIQTRFRPSDRVVEFGPFTTFVARDNYHLVPAESQKFASQVLLWFASVKA